MIPSFEINHFAEGNMFCVFCGAQICFSDASPQYCPHVLFGATDDGYWHEAGFVADMLPSFDAFQDGKLGNDEDKTFLKLLCEVSGFPDDSFIIEAYTSVPQVYGLYVGFSSSAKGESGSV